MSVGRKRTIRSGGGNLARKIPTLLGGALFFAVILAFPMTAFAYVGPGAGITALGALWGLILAVLIALGGFLVWPIRAFLRRRKREAAANGEPAAGELDRAKGE